MIALVYLGVIYLVLAAFFFSLMYAADRADARRRRSNPIAIIGVDRSALPLAVAIPTAHRRKHPSRWP